MNLQDSLRRDAVSAVRLHEPVTLGSDATILRAVEQMREHGAGCIVVVDGDKPIGMFTERDLLTKVLAQSLPLSTPMAKVMTSPPVCVAEGCSVASAIRSMHEGGFRHLPLVDENKKLLGVLSVRRIVDYLVEHFPSAVFTLPPGSQPQQFAREGA